MKRILIRSVVATALMSLGASAAWIYAQNGPTVQGEEAIVEPIPSWAFPILRSWQVNVVQNPGFAVAAEGTYIAANELTYDVRSRVVDVAGDVELTLVRADGSMVRMTTDNLRITEID